MTNPTRQTDPDGRNAASIHFTIYNLDKIEMKLDDDGDLVIRDRTKGTLNTFTMTIPAALIAEYVADIQRVTGMVEDDLAGLDLPGASPAELDRLMRFGKTAAVKQAAHDELQARTLERGSRAGRGVG